MLHWYCKTTYNSGQFFFTKATYNLGQREYNLKYNKTLNLILIIIVRPFTMGVFKLLRLDTN